jgi:hypothetical protein
LRSVGIPRLRSIVATGVVVVSWSCAIVSGVDQLQKVECLDRCDASVDSSGSDASVDSSGSDASVDSSGGDAAVDSSGGDAAVDSSGAPSDGSPAGTDGSDGGIQSGSAYRAAVLADGPVGYWRLGEPPGSTTCHDELNLHDGVVGGVVVFGATGALAHDPNTAAQFEGAGTISVGASFTFTADAPFSWEVWVRPAVLNGNYRPFFNSMVFDTNGSPVDGTYMISYSDMGDTFGFERYNGSAQVVIALDTAGLEVNQWTYIVATSDASGEGVVYMNGVAVIEAKGVGSVPSYNAGTVFGQQFTGELDEIAIYDHALSVEAVMNHWNAGTQ